MTWALPDWIDRRLPRIRIEGHAADEEALDAELSRDEGHFPDPRHHAAETAARRAPAGSLSPG